MTDDCCRHDANRSCTSDEDIFAQYGERQDSVHCVAQWIEECSNLKVDARSMVPNVRHWQSDVLGKSTSSINADARSVFTKVSTSCHAVTATTANNVPFTAHDIACCKVTYIRTHFNNFTHEFVADNHRHGHGLLRPGIPIIDMDICATDTRFMYANQNVIDSIRGLWHIDEF